MSSSATSSLSSPSSSWSPAPSSAPRNPYSILVVSRNGERVPTRPFYSSSEEAVWFGWLNLRISRSRPAGSALRPIGIDFPSVCQANGLEAIPYDEYLRSVVETTEVDPDALVGWVATFVPEYARAVAAYAARLSRDQD